MKAFLKKIFHALKRSPAAPAMNGLIAAGAFFVGTVGGLSNYARTGQVSHSNWYRILRAHCLTNGRSTVLLNLVTRLARPPRRKKNVTGLLGRFSVSQQNEIVRTLHSEGYYVFPQLISETLCDEIQSFAAAANTVVESNRDLQTALVPYDPAHPVSRTYHIPEQDAAENGAMQRLMADPAFVAIAEAYLDTLPIVGGVNVWWSAVYGNAPGSEAAQLFHFDFDAPPAWLKLFIYVTDVGPESGPHVYVRGSHKPALAQAREFRARGYERIEDDEIVAAFGPDAAREILGKRGTVFLADTRGFHKGKMPRTGDRLIAQLVYCSPLFNDRGARPNLPAHLEPSLAEALAVSPRVYDRFQKPAAGQ